MIRVDASPYNDSLEANVPDIFGAKQKQTASGSSARELPKHGIGNNGAAKLPKDEPWIAARNYVELDEDIFNGQSFRFSPAPGLDYEVVVDRVMEMSSSRRRLVGRLFDTQGLHAGSVTLAEVRGDEGAAYSGRFATTDGDVYLLQHNQDGDLVVDTTNQQAYPTCAEAPAPEMQAATHEENEHNHFADAAAADEIVDADLDGGAEVGADAIEITVLVAYTKNARSAQGGTAAIQAVAQNAVDAANTAYSNSQIGIRLRLVGTVEYNYSNSNFGTALSHLRGTSDGNMDGIHALRELYSADMVALLNNSTQYCGMAYLLPGTSASYRSYAKGLMFSVIYRGCAVGYLSFAHELGHNMGAMHDKNQPGSGIYSYSHGYHFGGYRSVMAYAPGTRVAHFSNPYVLYRGLKTGLSHTDNARTLNNTASFVASFNGPSLKISGRVVDNNGDGVAGAVVSGGIIGQRTTLSDGSYEFSAVAQGTTYTLTPSNGSGHSFAPANVSAVLYADATHDFVMNAPPVVSPIADQQMLPNRSLQIPLVVTDLEGDPFTLSATVTDVRSIAYDLQQQYRFYLYGGKDDYNLRGHNERYIRSPYSFNDGAKGKWYVMNASGSIFPWLGDITSSLNSIPLARLGAGYHQNLSLLLNATTPPQTAPATVTVSGIDLSISPAQDFEGVFQVGVTASDNAATGPTRTFFVTVHNNPPVLDAIDNQTVSPGQDVVVTLSAIDSDGDPITYSADITDSAAAAYSLQQTYGFYQYGGSYDRNKRGANEVYMRARRPQSIAAGAWYVMMPDGALYPWRGSIATSTSAVPLGVLGSVYNTYPERLINATPADGETPAMSSISGNTLTLIPADGFIGSFGVTATASDGSANDSKSFTVSVMNTPPVLQAISNKTASPGDNIVVTLSATDADGDAIGFSTEITDSSALAYQLQQTYGFYQYGGSYDRNKRGANEVYMRARRPQSIAAGAWYVMMPDGALYPWRGSISASTSAATLGVLGTAYNTYPERLISATQPSGDAPAADSLVW